MPESQLNLPVAPLLKVSGSFAGEAKPSEHPRKSFAWADIPEIALKAARVDRKVAAGAMDKSQSWLSRALRGLEKLGWLDLGAIDSKEFWRELVDLILDYHDLPSPGMSAQDREDIIVGRAFREMVQRSQAR